MNSNHEKVLVRDNYKDTTPVQVARETKKCEDDNEYLQLLLSKLDKAVSKLNGNSKDASAYADINVLVTSIRDLNNVPSMEVQHLENKKNNIEGMYYNRLYITQ